MNHKLYRLPLLKGLDVTKGILDQWERSRAKIAGREHIRQESHYFREKERLPTPLIPIDNFDLERIENKENSFKGLMNRVYRIINVDQEVMQDL